MRLHRVLLVGALLCSGVNAAAPPASVMEPYVLVCVDTTVTTPVLWSSCDPSLMFFAHPEDIPNLGSSGDFLEDLTAAEVAQLVAAMLNLFALAWVFKTLRRLIGGKS